MEVLNEFCYDLRENGRQKHRPLPTWSEIKPGHGEIFVGQQLQPKIQQTKMLVTCQRFSDLLLFGLVWQYSSVQTKYKKVGSKSWLLTCSSNITLSLPP